MSDDKQPVNTPSLSRRQFLSGAGGTAVAAVIATDLIGSACTSTTKSEAPSAGAAQKVATKDGTYPISLKVNGPTYDTAVDPRWSLTDVLREKLGLTGTKIGCDRGECGACTVLVDGLPIYGCMMLAVAAEGKEITSIEGLTQNGVIHPLQTAFHELGAIQCGFCTPGMILAAKAILDKKRTPSEDEIREGIGGNYCRCTGYYKIIEAVQAAAKNV
jgi:carbon-monoxide dehydrogenase small subunit